MGISAAAFHCDITPPLGHPLCAGWYPPAKAIEDSLSAHGLILAGEASASSPLTALGVFQGVQTNNALVAGRFGADVGGLDLGFVFQTQKDADLTGSSDFFGWNIDAAYSKKLGPGTATVDGGFFQYDLDGAAYVPGAGLNEGLGGYVVGAYALDDYALKAGKLTVTPQPFVRYQNFQFDGANDGEQVRWDAGANLILHEATNTKLTVNYFNDELQGITNEGVLVGIQFAF